MVVAVLEVVGVMLVFALVNVMTLMVPMFTMMIGIKA